MQKTHSFTICSCSSWLTCKLCLKALPLYKLRKPERNFKKSKSFHLCGLKCRQKLRPMTLDCSFFMFRGIYHNLIEGIEGIYSRFVQNVKIVKLTFSTWRDVIRTTSWACAICQLFENLLPAASYNRRVSDLKVPNRELFFLFFLITFIDTHKPIYNTRQKSTILTVAKLIQPWAIVNKNKREI